MANTSIRLPRLQNLFLVVVASKVALSFLAWYLNSPWMLGFWFPLALMGLYIAVGFLRDRSTDISDERFGDSCYYLGFIFTISSIAASLLDVPLLEQQGKLKDIAVRFGAAMVSTFLGFMVRAFVAGFKTDSEDAIRTLDDRLIATAELFRTRLEMAAEQYQSLDAQIQKASQDAIIRVNLAAEAVGKSVADGYANALRELSLETKKTLDASAGEIATATSRASSTLQKTSTALEDAIDQTQSTVDGFTKRLAERLDSATFPHEAWEASLKEPLAEIRAAISRYPKSIERLEATVDQSAQDFAAAMKRLEQSIAPAGRLGGIERLETAMDQGAQDLTASMKRLEQSLLPEGKLGQALAQHYDALGSLIGLAEQSQKLTSDNAEATLRSLATLSKSVDALRESLGGGGKEQLDEITKCLRDLVQRDELRTGQQKRLSDALNELVRVSGEVASETKSLSAAVRAGPRESMLGRIFGGRS